VIGALDLTTSSEGQVLSLTSFVQHLYHLVLGLVARGAGHPWRKKKSINQSRNQSRSGSFRGSWKYPYCFVHTASERVSTRTKKMIGVSIFLRFVSKVMELIFDIINTFVLWGTMLFGYICLSLVIYAVLRRIVVPEKLHVRPVHFNYE